MLILKGFEGDSMNLSSEFFVLAVFLAGIFLYWRLLKDSALPGRHLFFVAFLFFLVSNIATVVEEFLLYRFFDMLEQICITGGSLFLLAGILKLTAPPPEDKSEISGK